MSFGLLQKSVLVSGMLNGQFTDLAKRDESLIPVRDKAISIETLIKTGAPPEQLNEALADLFAMAYPHRDRMIPQTRFVFDSLLEEFRQVENSLKNKHDDVH